MQFKKYAACVAFGFAAIFTATAQDLMPEALPKHTPAEAKIKEADPVKEVTTAVQPTSTATDYNAAFGENVVRTALQYLGTRYSSGASGPTAFDCSGFTSFVYRKEDVPILRSSRSQFTQGTPVASIADLKKGDLVFFGGRGGSRSVGHVGIVVDVDPSGSNFSFVHAASGGVKISDSKEPYYSRRYIGARRIVGN